LRERDESLVVELERALQKLSTNRDNEGFIFGVLPAALATCAERLTDVADSFLLDCENV
jgi:hypothetical protein